MRDILICCLIFCLLHININFFNINLLRFYILLSVLSRLICLIIDYFISIVCFAKWGTPLERSVLVRVSIKSINWERYRKVHPYFIISWLTPFNPIRSFLLLVFPELLVALRNQLGPCTFFSGCSFVSTWMNRVNDIVLSVYAFCIILCLVHVSH